MVLADLESRYTGFPIGTHLEASWRRLEVWPRSPSTEKTVFKFIRVAASGPRIDTDLVVIRLPMTPGTSGKPFHQTDFSYNKRKTPYFGKSLGGG